MRPDRIRHGERETLSKLVNRVLNMAKIAFKDAVQRDRDVQSQLAECYTDAIIRNTFVRTGVAGAAPKTFTLSQWGHRLRDWSLPKGTCLGWDGLLEKERNHLNGREQWGRVLYSNSKIDHTPERNKYKPRLGPRQMACSGCGQSGYLKKNCTQMRRAFALFGQ